MAMALPLGKLTILVGAGVVGSILAKDGHMSGVSDFVSGAFKFAFRQLKHSDSSPSVKKPRNDYLVAQVDNLRRELQILASNRPVTIVTGQGSGANKYSIIIVVLVVGYGYVWWKGWKLPDMTFVTRGSLSAARDSISKQLESALKSISTTRRQVSSRIDGVENRLDEVMEMSATAKDEASLLGDKSKEISFDLQSVCYKIQNMESRIDRFEENQEVGNEGVFYLCGKVQTMEQNVFPDCIEASSASSSLPALEALVRTPSRTESLPPVLLLESLSPDSNGTPKVKKSPRNVASAWSLKEVGESSSRHGVANGSLTSGDKTNGSSSSGLSGMMFSGGNGPLLTRTRSVAIAVSQPMGSSSNNREVLTSKK